VSGARREWSFEQLIESWTLVDADHELIANKYGLTRLGFCLILKFFEIDARFPRHAGEVPPAAVEYVARQLGLSADDFAAYDFAGRSVKEHRRQIREALGFRVFSRGDEDKMIAWLAEEVCPSELNEDRQREAVLARCRAERLEPPGRMDRIVGAANRIADERFCAVTVSRLPADVAAALRSIVAESSEPEADELGDDADPSFFTELKADPGKLGLETLLAEITKLERVRVIGLPAELFADVAEKRIARWRARAVAEYPSTLRRDHPPEVSLTLLTVLCWCRLTEVTDSLVVLPIVPRRHRRSSPQRRCLHATRGSPRRRRRQGGSDRLSRSWCNFLIDAI
jgi:hypothetical protein